MNLRRLRQNEHQQHESALRAQERHCADAAIPHALPHPEDTPLPHQKGPLMFRHAVTVTGVVAATVTTLLACTASVPAGASHSAASGVQLQTWPKTTHIVHVQADFLSDLPGNADFERLTRLNESGQQ